MERELTLCGAGAFADERVRERVAAADGALCGAHPRRPRHVDGRCDRQRFSGRCAPMDYHARQGQVLCILKHLY